jgi:hypothetical protein
MVFGSAILFTFWIDTIEHDFRVYTHQPVNVILIFQPAVGKDTESILILLFVRLTNYNNSLKEFTYFQNISNKAFADVMLSHKLLKVEI